MQFEYLDSKETLLRILTETEFEDQIRHASEHEDVSEVTVERLSPGLSGAAVFLIRRISSRGPLIPLVAKACTDEKLLIVERDNFRSIQNRLPEAALFVCSSPRLLVFTFGGHLANRRPVTLRSGYASSSPESLAVLMRRIADGLRAIQTISPGTLSCVQRMPLLQRLDELASLPLALDVKSRLADAWRRTILQSHAIPAIRTTAHGDLNAGNILFEAGTESSYPVFIDFASMKRSKDNVGYQAEGFHLPFWDYAKLERDIQTRLFVKEAIVCGTSPGDIISTIKGINGAPNPIFTNSAVEKLLTTTIALRKRVFEQHSRDDQQAYGPVLAYSMLSVLFREQPDTDIPHDLQMLAAAEASIALLSNSGTPPASPPSLESGAGLTEPLETYIFVGRDDDVAEIRKLLSAERKPGTNRTVVVHGISGVGKSTLARVLSRDPSLNHHFPGRVLWTSLGPSPVITECLRRWHKELTGRELPECGLEDAKRLVDEALEGQSRLLIVDDVWSLEDLNHIPSGGNGCVRFVTTRRADLASRLGIPSRDEYHLRMLSARDSFALLDELAHYAIQDFEPEARLLVDALEGLPLAIQVAGRLLRAERANKYNVKQLLDELRDAKTLLERECPDNMRDLVSQTLPTVALVLRKSTDRLDPLTRERFAWLGQIAPKPALFEIDLLRKLWKNPGDDSLRASIRTLVDRGLIEPVQDDEYWMHGLFVALADSLCERKPHADAR